MPLFTAAILAFVLQTLVNYEHEHPHPGPDKAATVATSGNVSHGRTPDPCEHSDHHFCR